MNSNQTAGGPVYVPVEAERAAAFLLERYGGGVRDLARVGHGEWSRAFAFRRGNGRYVARFSAIDEDFAKDARVARFRSPALPVPRIVDAGAALGGFFSVSVRASGGYLDGLSGPRMRRLLPALFATLDAARAVDISDSTGYGLWGADGNAPHRTWQQALLATASDPPTTRTHGWRARLRSYPERWAAFERGMAALRALLPLCPEDRHLIHSDLLHYNVLVRGSRVTALLDWGSSLYGDYLYDIAWLAFWSPWFPAWRGIDFAAEAARHYAGIGLATPHFAERLRCYQIHIGLDGQTYSAFRERWQEVDATARRTLAVAEQR